MERCGRLCIRNVTWQAQAANTEMDSCLWLSLAAFLSRTPNGSFWKRSSSRGATAPDRGGSPLQLGASSYWSRLLQLWAVVNNCKAVLKVSRTDPLKEPMMPSAPNQPSEGLYPAPFLHRPCLQFIRSRCLGPLLQLLDSSYAISWLVPKRFLPHSSMTYVRVWIMQRGYSGESPLPVPRFSRQVGLV